MENKNHLPENIAAFLILAVSLVIAFIAHRIAPFMLDDLWYGTNIATDGPLNGISDVVESQVWHYLNWGGRSVTHTMLQFVLMGGELFADILNVFMTAILSFVIVTVASRLAGVKLTVCKKVLYTGAVVGMLHGLNANWLMSMYWQSGSVNYLYITTFILLFMWCYIRELGGEPVNTLKGIVIWIAPLGLITGWSNENMGPTAFLISLFTILYFRKKKKPVKVWMIVGSVFSLIGSVACILAPGNFVRSAEVDAEKGFLWKMYLRIYSEVRGGFDFMFAPVILTIFLLVLFYPVLKNKWDLRIIVILAAAVVSWGAMILSPHYPDRATFGTMVLLLAASLSLIMGLHKQKPELKWWLNAAVAVIWIRGMFWLGEYISVAAGLVS